MPPERTAAYIASEVLLRLLHEAEAERDRLREMLEGPLGIRSWLASPQTPNERLEGIHLAVNRFDNSSPTEEND